jgi:hypothetical protein
MPTTSPRSSRRVPSTSPDKERTEPAFFCTHPDELALHDSLRRARHDLVVSSLPGAVVNERLTTPDAPVWKIDVLPCKPGDRFRVVFESDDGLWRHGVRLMVDGVLAAEATTADQVVLWSDTAPTEVDIAVESASDGLLRVYNVWDSGRGRREESQAATSGMLRDDTANGWRYRCSDIATEPTFDALVFRIERD